MGIIAKNNIVSINYGLGLSIFSCTGHLNILNNKVNILLDCEALDISSCVGASSDYQMVYNNFFTVQGQGGGDYGMWGRSNKYQKWSFNNVLVINQGYALDLGGGSNIFVQNNNFVALNASSGYALSVDSPNVKTLRLDYNNYFSKAKNKFKYNSYDYSSLSTYQVGAAQDKHSISINPQFFSNSNLHVKDTGLIGKGLPLSGIIDDIDGDIRSASAPTIGADEIGGGKAKFGVQTACLGDNAVFSDSSIFNGSDSIISWAWAFGDGGSSLLQNPTHLYKSAGPFTAQLKITTKTGFTDSITHSLSMDTTCQHLLKGVVSTSLGTALKSSKLYLCTYNATDSTVKVIDSLVTDTSGNYSFRTNDTSVYLFAMPKLLTYPYELPTWADTGVYFGYAGNIALHLGTNIKNFKTIFGSNSGGIGFIGGKVNYCYLCKTFGTGTPAAGVRVILADSNGKAQAYTYVDANGYFTFNKISISKYKILVDLPLINNKVAPAIQLVSSSPFMSNLSFTLFPTYLALNSTTGIEVLSQHRGYSIHPNPASGVLNFHSDLAQEGKLIICDLAGKVWLSRIISGQDNNLNIADMPAGIYLLKYQGKDKVWVEKLVKE